MIVCTAGHVDHGKTALVKALTGVDTDRLAEERRRGLTIELGFAPLDLPGLGRVSVVDVPGHQQFIPTMLSGCCGLDGVLFTVAADEGPMPQTAEHLDILTLLGAERGVIAMTRADLASPDRLAESLARTRALTAGTFLESAPAVPVSALTGAGLDGLRSALADMLAQAPPPPEGSPRLHIDRVFSVEGSGTVVTGTLTGGPLRRGDAVQLCPSERTARVRELNDRLRAGLAAFPTVEINSPADAVPEILNFSQNRIKSETMLAWLAEQQVYVSSASACGRGQPSHTLAAMGRSDRAIDTAIRVSFCADNTPEDVDAFLERFEAGMKTLASF